MKNYNKLSILFIFFVLFSTLLSACTALKPISFADLPPILSDIELTRPYIVLGRIQATRESFKSEYSLSSDITAWGLAALRKEAAQMGADAVIQPDVTVRTISSILFPSTEFQATGIAIKFSQGK